MYEVWTQEVSSGMGVKGVGVGGGGGDSLDGEMRRKDLLGGKVFWEDVGM